MFCRIHDQNDSIITWHSMNQPLPPKTTHVSPSNETTEFKFLLIQHQSCRALSRNSPHPITLYCFPTNTHTPPYFPQPTSLLSAQLSNRSHILRAFQLPSKRLQREPNSRTQAHPQPSTSPPLKSNIHNTRISHNLQPPTTSSILPNHLMR